MANAFGVNLQRPSPMALHYRTNGGGRDSYIYADNGGFSVLASGSGHEAPGTMPQKRAYASPSGAPKLSPAKSRPMHYVHNGQGRDSYISSTHGGFMSPHVISPGKGTFFNRLRAYERSEQRSFKRSPSLQSLSPDGSPTRGRDEYGDGRPDHFQMGQSLITNKRSIASILQTKKEQKHLSHKLSQPKLRPAQQHRYQSFRFGRMLALEDGPFDSSANFASGNIGGDDARSGYSNVLGDSAHAMLFRKKRATMADSRQGGDLEAFKSSNAVKYAEMYKADRKKGQEHRHKSVTRNLMYDNPVSRNHRRENSSSVLPDINRKGPTNLLAYEDVLRNLPELKIGATDKKSIDGEMLNVDNPYQLR